ncbi:MAG: response regulator [candidate division Zixibacteria bacterium]|nr:response regulator [candidate division Zixibacteria bacterium]
MKEEPKVLVVDDEEMLRNLLARILEREGYSVSTADGGKQALASLEKSDFEIMVSDVKMPEMSGLELLKEARQKYPRMAVLMMTPFGDDYTVQQALGLGADGYVAKPFKSHDLISEVERARRKAASHFSSSAKKA